jgi:hypothetical protein
MMAAASLGVVTMKGSAAGSSSSGRQQWWAWAQGRTIVRHQEQQGAEDQVQVLPLWRPSHLQQQVHQQWAVCNHQHQSHPRQLPLPLLPQQRPQQAHLAAAAAAALRHRRMRVTLSPRWVTTRVTLAPPRPPLGPPMWWSQHHMHHMHHMQQVVAVSPHTWR